MANYDVTSGSYTLRLTVNETATSTPNNTSTVTFSLELIKNSGSGLWNNNNCSWSININGTAYSGTFTYDFRNYSSLTLKSNTTQVIEHDSDGTKSISVSAYANMDNTPYVYPLNASGTLALTTIPRASDVSVSNYSIVNTTGSLSATITSKANFYHRWRWKLADGSWSSWTNKGAINNTSATVTVANTTLLAQLPSATSGAFTIEVETHSGTAYSSATLIGTKQATCTVSVDTSKIKPSVSLGNIGINSSPIANYAVAGYSKVQSAFTATKSSGASGVTTYFTVSHGSLATKSSTATSGTVVSEVIPSNASNYTLTIYAYAKDSRGAISDTVSKAITVYGYQPPTANLTAYRTTSSSSTNEDGAGTYAYVTFSGAVRSTVNNQNSVQSVACTYSGSISGTATSGGHYALADNQSVTFTLTVTDKVTSSTAIVNVTSAIYALDLYDNGSGVVGGGVGALAKANQFNFGVSLASNLGNYQEIMVDLTRAEMMAYDTSLTGSSTDDVWLTVMLKMLCVKYPAKEHIVFKGMLQPNSYLFYEVMIYNTSTVNNGLPQYSFGYYSGLAVSAAPFRTFGTHSYNFYFTDGVQRANSSSTATNANNIHTTALSRTSYAEYYPTLVGGASTANQQPYVYDGMRLGLKNGTASADGNATLMLGNSTASGTAGNKQGILSLFSTNSYKVNLYSAELNGNKTQYLPNANGTLALHDTQLWTGSLTGTNSIDLDISTYKRIRIYALYATDRQMIWEVDVTKLHASTQHRANHCEISWLDNGWYHTIFETFISKAQFTLSNVYNMDTSGTTYAQNNSTGYQIYRIDGIL